MAEAVGVVASVIAIAGLAYHGSKNLYEAVDKYQNAPKTMSSLRTELDIVQQLLQSVERNLANTKDEDLSEALRQCLQDFKPSLEGLKLGCDEFSEKLNKLTNHSTDSDVSKRDRFKLQFEEKSIEAFRYRLSSHKLSINIALGLISYTSSNQSRRVLDDLQKNITTAINKISGQLEGLEITVQHLGSTESSVPQTQALKSLRGQEIALGQCLKVCTSAVEAAPPGMKAAIETMESFEEAKQLVVLTKGGHGLVEAMVARGSSRQMFMDTVKEGEESKMVNDFFK